jgi:hypothetical protein
MVTIHIDRRKDFGADAMYPAYRAIHEHAGGE